MGFDRWLLPLGAAPFFYFSLVCWGVRVSEGRSVNCEVSERGKEGIIESVIMDFIESLGLRYI
jgi:hypothetical protein